MDDPIITLTIKRDGLRWTWLRYVTGFDVGSHCAQCLLGEYAPQIRLTTPATRKPAGFSTRVVLADFPARFFYLCAVAECYERNSHVPFMADDDFFDFEDDNLKVHVEGGRLLEIDPPPISVRHIPHKFWTCRCWAFGLSMWPEARKRIPPPPPRRRRSNQKDLFK
jgi:hypothetical protein